MRKEEKKKYQKPKKRRVKEIIHKQKARETRTNGDRKIGKANKKRFGRFR